MKGCRSLGFVLGLLFLPLAVGAQSPTLTLDQAWKATLDNNKTLQLRQSEYRVAQDGLQEAASRLWPTLSFNSSASYLTDPQKGVTIKAGSLGNAPNANAKFPTPVPGTDIVLVPDPLHTYFKLGTTLSVPLFTWGKLSQAVHLAEVQVNLASLNTEKTTEETRRDVRKAYFGSVMARETLGVLKKMEELMLGLMKDRKLNFEQGTVNKEAVLEMAGRLADITGQRKKVEQGLKTASLGLGLLTGIKVDPATLTDTMRTNVAELDLEALQEKAWVASSARKILERQQELAKGAQQIEEASGPLHPDFGLNIQFEFNGQAVPYSSNWRDTWNPNITISVGTNGTWFDGFKADARVKSAYEKVLQAQAGMELLKQGLTVQVQQSVETVTNALSGVASKQAALALADERNRNAQVAFKNELATREDSQGAQLGELVAEIDDWAAKFQFELSLIDLEFLTGVQFQS